MKEKSDKFVKDALIDFYELKGKDFKFDIEPVAKPRMTKQDKWMKRPCVVKYWDFKEEILWQAEQIKFELPDQFLIVYYIPLFSSYTKKKKDELRGKPHKARPDIDNLNKAVLDAFKVEDASIWSHWSRKYWSDDPSIVITI